MTKALIIGAGEGISAAFARRVAAAGGQVALAARRPDKLANLVGEIGASAFACDASQPAEIEQLFATVDQQLGGLDLLLYNPSYRFAGPIAELDPAKVALALQVTAFGAFLAGQQAARRMLSQGHGTILFTGASASIKGYPNSAPFAMGKFALRGLAQSMARELAPKNIHVAHFVIDGAVRNPGRSERADQPDSMLDPEAIATSYWQVAQQPRSAWSWELELRPWTERF